MNTLFSRIVTGDAPADIVYQDELVTAFRDIHPVAPTHILVVPNKVIPTLNEMTEADESLAGRMILVARRLAASEGIAKDGYRLIINCNQHGRQHVYHLHLHLIGGRQLGAISRSRPRNL